MPRKPSNLIYGVDESPGGIALILLGFQHISLLALLEVLGSLRVLRLLLDLLGGARGLLLPAAGVLGRHNPHPAQFARHGRHDADW